MPQATKELEMEAWLTQAEARDLEFEGIEALCAEAPVSYVTLYKYRPLLERAEKLTARYRRWQRLEARVDELEESGEAFTFRELFQECGFSPSYSGSVVEVRPRFMRRLIAIKEANTGSKWSRSEKKKTQRGNAGRS